MKYDMVGQVGYRLIQIMRYFRGINYLGLGCTIHPQYSKSRSLDDKMTDKMITHAIDLIFLRWCEHDRQTLFYTLITMLQGKSATPQTLSKCYDIPINQILQAHETDRYDVDESNNVIDVFGFGINADRPLTFTNNTGTFKLCCALIALTISRLSDKSSHIHSVDPVSSRAIEIQSSSKQISVVPNEATAVIATPSQDKFLADPWHSFCKFVQFFESDHTASQAMDRNDTTSIVSVARLWEAAGELCVRMWAASDLELRQRVSSTSM